MRCCDHVSLTEKGQEFWRVLDGMFERHAGLLDEADIQEETLADVSMHLKSIERFWNLVRARVPRAPEPLVGRPVTSEEASKYFQSQKRAAMAY